MGLLFRNNSLRCDMQNKTLLVLLSVLFLPFISLAQSKVPFEMPKDFSVDVVMNAAAANITTHMVVKGNLARSEANMMGKTMVSIIRKDKGVIWVLMPEQSMYMEQPLPKNMPTPSEIPNGTWEKQTDENLAGQDCEKWTCTFDVNGKSALATYWINKSSKLPVQMEMTINGAKIVGKNFKAETSDASLFEIPADYKKMGM